jgi:hypothetical protein
MPRLKNNGSFDLKCPVAWVGRAGLRKVVLFFAVGLAAWIVTPAAGWGQCAWELIAAYGGQANRDVFGYSVSGAGDVNNDGSADVIIGAPGNDEGGDDAGQAYVYSGDGYLYWIFTGEAPDDNFGYSVSGAGDVDNDGYADLIVGAPENDGGGTNAGRAYVYSGQTGGVLWTFTGEAAGDKFGYSVSGAGDVNNDGHADLIVGAPENDGGGTSAGRAYVYSGQTGGLLHTFTGEASYDDFGHSVSGAGDVTNNGYDDLIVGSPGYDAGGDDHGRVYVYTGQLGLLYRVSTGESAGDRFGSSVSGAGDMNDDGYDDVIIGAPYNDQGGGNAGRSYVHCGQTGGLLYTFTGVGANHYLGYSVSGAGDLNDDGFDDVIVGAPGYSWPVPDVGRASVYSGRTGRRLASFTGDAASDNLGFSVSGAGDVNNDGCKDLIVGAFLNDQTGTDAGRASIYSGHTGVICFTGEAAGDFLGYSVSGAGDVNNDGYDDLIVGAPLYDDLDSDCGRAYVYSGETGDRITDYIGSNEFDNLGYSVSGAGDVNNDGYADVICGVPNYDDGGSTDAGKVTVRSPHDFTLLWNFTGDAAGDHFGLSVSGAVDYDNDGYDDLVIGAPGSDAVNPEGGRVYVYSGLTGSRIYTFDLAVQQDDNLGRSVSGAGDVNNDGYDDIMMGQPMDDDAGENAGRAWCGTGDYPGWLWSGTGEAAGDQFGYSVSGAGDVNNDGYDDFIVGARFSDAVGSNSGRAYVYSGENWDLLHSFPGEAAGDNFGHSVSGAGDVNNDGYDDLIVGAHSHDAGTTNAGRAYIFCGETGALLCTFDGMMAYDNFGFSVSGAGDVDNDGYDEVIVGAPANDAGGEDAGRAYVFGCEAYATHLCGDCNSSGAVEAGDVVYLISYLFRGGPAPGPLCIGDANCSDAVAADDVVYLISYLFRGGLSPCPYCCLA